MGVVDTQKIWSGETSSSALDLSGQVVSLVFAEVFDIVVDNTPTVDSSLTVRQHPGFIQEGDSHPDNPFLICHSVRMPRTSPITFRATVEYRTISGGQVGGDNNPVNEPPIIRYKTVKTEGEIDEDINGNPLVTANGEPIRGLRRSFSDLALEISQNFTTFNAFQFHRFIDVVSSDTFAGFPPGAAYVDDISADLVQGTTFSFWKVSAVIIFRRAVRTVPARAWYSRVLHEGYIVKNAAGDLVHAIDDNGEYVTKPVRLRNDGTQETDPAVAEWLEFEILESDVLGAMGFNV